MDLSYFMRERTRIIRLFYEEARIPFEQLKQRIEDGVSPFEPPPFNPDYDSEEPPFLNEWMEAEQTRELVGMLAVSLLSDTLRLYFMALEREIGLEFTSKEARKQHFKKGFVEAYRQILEHIMGEIYASCPIRFDLIEQVVLARNDFHHSNDFLTFQSNHNIKTLEKHPNPFFVSEDRQRWDVEQDMPWHGLPIEVSRERLLEAITEVEKLADWVQDNDATIWAWRRGTRKAKDDG
ncbi:hypothetical protein [Azospirillum brasilense]|uniref:hypothetical protein n=1 Tax=Azospirillum brasilense TaxID=192 RepID=UPI000E0A6D99|nr:hypothetical protein [Azospirillum brasilense]